MNLHKRRYFKLLENNLALPHELLLMIIPKIDLDLDYQKPMSSCIVEERCWERCVDNSMDITRDYYQSPMTEMIIEELTFEHVDK